MIKAIKPVYSYYFPEIRKIINETVADFPHEIFLQSIDPGLDDFHFPIIKKYLKTYAEYFKGLEKFPYRYVTSGSSEGIFHLLTWIKTNYPKTPVYILKGEYEGYGGYGGNIGIEVKEVEFNRSSISKLPKGIWFISNPSARDGNIIPNKKIIDICEAGHKVIYDGAYVGLTKPYRFDLSHPNFVAAVVSLSKPLGLFYYRVGFVFTRNRIKTLYPNIWFKNILSLIIADRIFSKLPPDYLFKKYKPIQKEILDQIREETGIEIAASDALILGHLTKKVRDKLTPPQKKMVERFKRGDGCRFCLTPYFLEREQRT